MTSSLVSVKMNSHCDYVLVLKLFFINDQNFMTRSLVSVKMNIYYDYVLVLK